MTIRWTTRLSVGIETIDEQHRELFRRAGSFLDGVSGRSRQEVGILLSYLRSYAVTHFGEEEEAMRNADYPGYEVHRREHDGLLRDLLALSKEQERRDGPGVRAEHLGNWLRGWLESHVRRVDTKMARHLLDLRDPDAPARRVS
jgi:hemerythrin